MRGGGSGRAAGVRFGSTEGLPLASNTPSSATNRVAAVELRKGDPRGRSRVESSKGTEQTGAFKRRAKWSGHAVPFGPNHDREKRHSGLLVVSIGGCSFLVRMGDSDRPTRTRWYGAGDGSAVRGIRTVLLCCCGLGRGSSLLCVQALWSQEPRRPRAWRSGGRCSIRRHGPGIGLRCA